MNIIEFIKQIPKAELHIHIEGSFEPELMFEIAERNNLEIPFKNVDELKSAYDFSNLQEFLDIYYQGANVLLYEQDFYDLTYAYLLKCKEDNVIYTEIFFDPQTHTHRGVSFEIIINGIYRACQDAETNLDISSKLIMCILRHLDEDDAIKTIQQAQLHKDKIIAIGLDSSEIGNPPEKFVDAFNLAKEIGFKLVAHAGEEAGPDYIWQAINLLNVDRIDHGVQCISDDKLVNYLVKKQISLTVCPLSNIKLKVFNNMSEHNIIKLLNMGVIVTVNSDDPAYFGGYMNDNFIALEKSLDITEQDIVKLAINSFKASFLTDEEIQTNINKINQYYEK